MKSILITGGAGFIGSHTCLVLLEKGYQVFVIDSFKNSSRKSLDRVLEIFNNRNTNSEKVLNIFKGDLCDQDFLKFVFGEIRKNNIKIDGVIHFAGYKSVLESIKDPIKYWKNNVLATINLLEMMDKNSCRNFVFSSSATVYSQKNDFPFKENSEVSPINPYGNTKLSVEILLEDIFKSSIKEWKIASLRYFNPIGAHDSGLIGEDPNGLPNNIFPLITNTAIGLQKELKIFGNDWPTEDGTPVRDFIHVMDLAESHIQVLEYLMRIESTYLNLNIGTGKGTSVLELVKTFEKVNDVKIPYVFVNRRPGDSCYVVADNSLSISKLNIIPKKDIEDMCRDGWRWKKLNPNGY